MGKTVSKIRPAEVERLVARGLLGFGTFRFLSQEEAEKVIAERHAAIAKATP